MKRAGELLSSFIGERFDGRFLEKARGYSEFFSSWAAILEHHKIAAAADHSRITELERHIVFVAADHPGWVQILQTKQKELLEALQRRYPAFEIRGIAFRYISSPPPPSPVQDTTDQPPPPPEPLPPEETGNIENTGRLEDPEFIDTLKRWKKDIISRERTRKK